MLPRIGLTTFGPELSACGCGCNGKTRPSHWLPSGYVKKILQNGGLPILLPPVPESYTDEVINTFDGLIVTGGGDISPNRYSSEHSKMDSSDKKIHGVDSQRDAFEISLTRTCIEKGIPLFGICRGMQVLNVSLGGTLHLDLSDDNKNTHTHRRPMVGGCIEHHVNVLDKSPLQKFLAANRFIVMSNHHQSVNRLGDDLVVTSVSDDNTIEAIQYTKNAAIFGVQWHPEVEGPDQDLNDLLFKRFISFCEPHIIKRNNTTYVSCFSG